MNDVTLLFNTPTGTAKVNIIILQKGTIRAGKVSKRLSHSCGTQVSSTNTGYHRGPSFPGLPGSVSMLGKAPETESNGNAGLQFCSELQTASHGLKSLGFGVRRILGSKKTRSQDNQCLVLLKVLWDNSPESGGEERTVQPIRVCKGVLYSMWAPWDSFPSDSRPSTHLTSSPCMESTEGEQEARMTACDLRNCTAVNKPGFHHCPKRKKDEII